MTPNIMERLPLSVRRNLGSTVDNLLKEGEKIGEIKALERFTRNMIQKGYSDKEICELLELCPHYVATVRRAVHSGK